MASSGKKKTTMAKLTRESRLRERRLDKQARKEARKQAAASHPDDTLEAVADESAVQDPGEPATDGAVQPPAGG
jgi:hypothetical protein